MNGPSQLATIFVNSQVRDGNWAANGPPPPAWVGPAYVIVDYVRVYK